MTSAELTPARFATSAMRVSPKPRSQISSAAARSISIRRASLFSVAGAGSAMSLEILLVEWQLCYLSVA